ncbi:MAG: hypothetical protein WB562_07385 [Candidatus Sulfotelmatobacter sp.]
MKSGSGSDGNLIKFLAMSPEARQRIQIALSLAIAVAAIRAGYYLYERHEENLAAQKQQQIKNTGYANPDYYVTPKKLYPFDLKSARQLTKQPVWAKEGYRYTYFRYDASTNRTDFGHDAGLLLPIDRLQVKDVVTGIPAGAGNRKQMLAVFEKEGKSFAVPIGFEAEGQYKIYSDEMFYVEDPHELYRHWPADVWQAIEQRQVKPGMNELQADFAIGMGVPDAGASSNEKTVRYPNGGKPVVVIYRGGNAVEIKAGT